MNPHQGHKRGMSQDEAIPSLMDLPKRGRFENMGGGALPRTSVHQNQHQGQGFQQAPVIEYRQGGRSGTGGPGGEGRGTGGSNVVNLMDLPLDNNSSGGSGNPMAHSHGGHSSFLDDEDDGVSGSRRGVNGGELVGRGTGGSNVMNLMDLPLDDNSSGGFAGSGNPTAHSQSSHSSFVDDRDDGFSGGRVGVSGGRLGGMGTGGSAVMSLMDLPLNNNSGDEYAGSGKPTAGSYSQSGPSSFVDEDDGDDSCNAAPWRNSSGRGASNQGSQGGGSRGRGSASRGQGFGHEGPPLLESNIGESYNQNQFGNDQRFERAHGGSSHNENGRDRQGRAYGGSSHSESRQRGDHGRGVETSQSVRPQGRGQGVGSMLSKLMDLSSSNTNQNQDNDNQRSEGQDGAHNSSQGGQHGGSAQRGRGQGVGSILSRLTHLSTISDNHNQFGDEHRSERQGGAYRGFGNRDGSQGGARGRGANRGRGQGVGSMLSRLTDLSSSSETSFLDSNSASGFGQGRGRGGFGGQGRGRGGFGEFGRSSGGFGEQGGGRGGFGDQGRRGFEEMGRGRGGFGNMERGREGFGEMGRERGGFGEMGRERGGFGEMGRGRGGFVEMGRGRGGFGEMGRGRGGFGGQGRGRGGHRNQDDGFNHSGNSLMGQNKGVGEDLGQGKIEKPKKKPAVTGHGKLMTRPNGTTYYLRYEHTLLKNADKFLEGPNQIPVLDRLQFLCQLAKPLLNGMPELDEAAVKFEELLQDVTVCLKPTYAIKGKRLEHFQPGDQPFEYVCKVFIENIFMAAETAMNKMEAKNLGCLTAIKLLVTKTAQVIYDTHDKVDDVTKLSKEEADIIECPFSSAESNIGNVLSVQDHAEEKTRADFYILEPEEMEESDGMKSTRMNSAFILRQSADFSHMLLAYEFTKSQQGFLCTVKLQGETIATGSASEQHKAKNYASHGALESLRQTNWTIVARTRDRPQPSKMSLHEKCGRIRPNDPRSKDHFVYKLKIFLKDYFAEVDDYTEWLTLPLKLNKAENDAVYELGKEMNLTVQARTPNGKRNSRMTANDPRFLVVTKKFQSRNLFDYIWEKGGETWRYRLKPPCEIGSNITN